jgi:CRISPR-associated endonuclease/helicase Cas3
VVILDEVQTLNKDLVLPTLDMLQNIQAALNTSFVFCTATMPAFEKREGFPGVEKIAALVDNPEDLFKQTIRVRFEHLDDLKPISYESLRYTLETNCVSTLAVLNTKRPVSTLYQDLRKSKQWDKVFHLTTNLCPHHRKIIIKEIQSILNEKKQKILVLSTQLVEAGVDFDFPCVFRELAPLESIIQAAGRCNREGKMEEPGRVVLFQLADAKAPDRFYKTQAQHVYSLLTSGYGDLYDYGFFQAYYKQILSLFVTQKQTITEERGKFNFTKVSEQYHLIPKDTQPIFIYKYNQESSQLYETIKRKEKLAFKLSREDQRELQQYSVQVYENFFRKTTGFWEELACGVRIWNGSYDEGLGLDIDSQYTDVMPIY